jgi:hypothetical protein
MVDRARITVSREKLTMTDTGGYPVYEMDMGTADQAGESDGDREARLYLERRICVDCGT